MGVDDLSDLRPDERAQIAAMLAERGEDEEDETELIAPAGPIRRVFRALLWLASLAAAGLMAWHSYALAYQPDTPFDAVHAPLGLTIGAGIAGALALLWFDWRWRRLWLLLIAAGALGVSGLSMRWVDSSRGGVREHFAGWQRSAVRVRGDLCYRIDSARFVLRGGRTQFVYDRLYWPGAFDEAAFRRYFFSNLPMAAGAGGWTCRARN